jgi:hypothetical protein
VFNFFCQPAFFKNNFANRTNGTFANGTFGFARNPDNYRDKPFAKPKEPFLSIELLPILNILFTFAKHCQI